MQKVFMMTKLVSRTAPDGSCEIVPARVGYCYSLEEAKEEIARQGKLILTDWTQQGSDLDVKSWYMGIQGSQWVKGLMIQEVMVSDNVHSLRREFIDRMESK